MIKRNHLKFGFSIDRLPMFICPRCSEGRLEPTSDLKSYEPNYSANWQAEHGHWDEIVLRLCATLRCSVNHCGEVSALRCIGGVEPDYSRGDEGPLEEYFLIRAFSPSPHIITLPESLPKSVKDELLSSFDVYWFNKKLAANAIRNSLEALLSHFGVPDEVDGKWVSFGNRLRTYAELNSEHSELFSVLRPIINSGSHGDQIETDTILDIYEALEIFLEVAFNDRSQRLTELKESLRKKTEGK